MGVSVLQKEERRTGARMFILSGAVCDDPLIFFECDVFNIDFEISQRNIDRALRMACGIGVRTSHVHNDRLARVKRSLGLIHRNARNTCL